MASQRIVPSDLPPSYEILGQPILVLNAPPTDDKDLIASIERKKFCIELGKERQYYEWFLVIRTNVFRAQITSKSTDGSPLVVLTRRNVNRVFASYNKDLPEWFYSAVESEEPENLEFYRKQNEDCRLIYGYVSPYILEAELYLQRIKKAQETLIYIPLASSAQVDGSSGRGNDCFP